MMNPRIKAILLFYCLTAFGAGCSNSLDTGDSEPLSTLINYQLNEETHVKLWIENSYSTTVATLVDEDKQAGLHTVTFTAVDSNGNNLPEGIYTYHIETDSFSQSRILQLFYQ